MIVGRLLDLGIGHFRDADVALAVVGDGFHGSPL